MDPRDRSRGRCFTSACATPSKARKKGHSNRSSNPSSLRNTMQWFAEAVRNSGWMTKYLFLEQMRKLFFLEKRGSSLCNLTNDVRPKLAARAAKRSRKGHLKEGGETRRGSHTCARSFSVSTWANKISLVVLCVQVWPIRERLDEIWSPTGGCALMTWSNNFRCIGPCARPSSNGEKKSQVPYITAPNLLSSPTKEGPNP